MKKWQETTDSNNWAHICMTIYTYIILRSSHGLTKWLWYNRGRGSVRRGRGGGLSCGSRSPSSSSSMFTFRSDVILLVNDVTIRLFRFLFVCHVNVTCEHCKCAKQVATLRRMHARMLIQCTIIMYNFLIDFLARSIIEKMVIISWTINAGTRQAK